MCAQAVQLGHVPIYVWDDLPWLPYRSLWEQGELGLSVRYDALAPLLLHNLSVAQRCASASVAQRARAGARATHDGCADAQARLERMRAGVRKWRRLFTYDGLLDEVEAFASSAGVRGRLQCEARGPVRNVEHFGERKLRPAVPAVVPLPGPGFVI